MTTRAGGVKAAQLADLALHMAGREVAGRYRGSFGGLTWTLLTPVLMLTIYTFVFSEIFGARWPDLGPGGEGPAGFALMVFGGMLLHGLLGEGVGRAPGLILANANFVKKTRFPLEILAVSQLLAGVAQLLPMLVVLLLFQTWLFGPPPLTALLFPLILLPLCLFVLGLMWAFSALTVYFRDLSQLTGPLVTALFFLSPILYPVSAVPDMLRPFMNLNPLTFAIEAGRGVLLRGELPAAGAYLVYLALSVVFVLAALALFRALKDGFADAI